MGNLTARHQKKVSATYDRKKKEEFDVLFNEGKQATPATPTPAPAVTPKETPGTGKQIATGSFHGAKKAVFEMMDSLDDLSGWIKDKTGGLPGDNAGRHNFTDLLHAVTGISRDSLRAEAQGQGTAYGISSGITQFVTAFLPVNRVAGALTKATRLSKATGAAKAAVTVGQGAVAGGVTSVTAYDPYEERLSNMIQEVPVLQNPITEYLQADPNDPKAVARMKNGVENALLGIGFDLGIEGSKALYSSLKAMKAARTLKAAGKPGEEALAAAQEVLKRETEAIRKMAPQDNLGDVIPQSKPDRFEGRVVDPNAPDPVKPPTEVDVPVAPKGSPEVMNPEVLPQAPMAKPDVPVPDDINERLINATREARVNALLKLEPDRPVGEIMAEVDAQIGAMRAAKAEGRSIEVIPEISGERIPLGEAPNSPLRDVPAGAEVDVLPQGSLDIPQVLPKFKAPEVPEEFQSSLLNPNGKPYDLREIPPVDESLLPPKLQELAANDRTSVTGLLGILNSQAGGITPGALAGIASTQAGAGSGLLFDYNGDGKVAGWEDIGIGLLIGTGGYVSARSLRKLLHGTPEEKVAAQTDILTQNKELFDNLSQAEESYEAALKGATGESKVTIENSLATIRAVKEAMTKYNDNPAALDKALNKAWVREKYRPLVNIPTGKSEAIVAALRDGKLEDISTAIGKDFNLEGIKAPEDLKEAIDGLTNLISEHIPEETAKMTRGVVSWDETIKGADELGVNLHNVNMLSRDTRKLSERLLAARVAMNSIKTPLVEVMDQILATNDPPAELLMKFREITSMAAAVQAEVKGSQTEVARALNSMKIAADTVRMDFDSVTRMMEQQGGKRQMVAAVQTLKQIMREGDQVKVNRYLRGIGGSPSLRFLNELHRTVLLSNPISHAANISGNFLAGIVNAGEATLAGIFSGRGLGDMKALIEGLAQKDTFSDALRFAKRAWTTSQSTIDPLISKVDGTELAHGISYDTFKSTYVGQGIDFLATGLGMDGVLGKGVDASGKFLRTTFDALGAEDEFFKVLNYRAALHREAYLEAYRTAVAEGLEGTALAKRVGILKAELVDSPSNEIFEKALQTTRVNTFTATPKGILGSMNNLVAKHPVLQLFIPFSRTPTNLINYVFDRVPGLTLYQQEIREALLHGTREQKAEIAARWATGGLLMSTALGLASAGMITGGGDTEQMAKRISGWQPYSIKVGDTYYSYNRLDPISSLLGLAADTHDIIQYAGDEGDAAKASTAALIAITRNLSSKTMLKGFTEMLDAISNGDKKLPTFAKSFALSWIPAGVGAAERLTDPVLRDTITFMDQVKAKIPGLSKELPPRRDIFGEPVMPEGGLGPDFLSPVAVSTASKDPVRQLFADLGIDTKATLNAMKQIDKVPLTAEQHSRYVELQGKRFKELMDRAVSRPRFQGRPENKDDPRSKQQLIQTLLGHSRDSARAKLLREFPELKEAIRQKRLEYRQTPQQ